MVPAVHIAYWHRFYLFKPTYPECHCIPRRVCNVDEKCSQPWYCFHRKNELFRTTEVHRILYRPDAPLTILACVFKILRNMAAEVSHELYNLHFGTLRINYNNHPTLVGFDITEMFDSVFGCNHDSTQHETVELWRSILKKILRNITPSIEITFAGSTLKKPFWGGYRNQNFLISPGDVEPDSPSFYAKRSFLYLSYQPDVALRSSQFHYIYRIKRLQAQEESERKKQKASENSKEQSNFNRPQFHSQIFLDDD